MFDLGWTGKESFGKLDVLGAGVGPTLVTTAIEQSWPEEGPVVFLGEWCRRYSRRDEWARFDHSVLPYHWTDKEKLEKDRLYLSGVYERFLTGIGERLNTIHCVDHGNRYWRIAIGPWLMKFVDLMFDRWDTVSLVRNTDDLDSTIVLSGMPGAGPAVDTDEFLKFADTDFWNHEIYMKILKHQTSIEFINHVWKPPDREFNFIGSGRQKTAATTQPPGWWPGIKSTTLMTYSSIAKKLVRESDAFLFRTYMPRRHELAVQARLKQIPALHLDMRAERVAVRPEMRSWHLEDLALSEFELFLQGMVPEHLPTIFLEGYGGKGNDPSNLGWPGQPRMIWTSNAHQTNDVFKLWAASKVEKGTALVIGQHGGRYGIAPQSRIECHELEICDRYLSWGWDHPGKDWIVPTAILKAVRPKRIRKKDNGRVTLVSTSVRQHTNDSTQFMFGPEWPSFFEEQCEFVEELPTDIQELLTIRLFPIDFGCDQEIRWRERFGNVALDLGDTDLHRRVARERLVVQTNNSTTYLESLSANIPTVIFWTSDYGDVRQSAMVWIQLLESVGIFHTTPVGAARHVSSIWDDVQGWWTSKAVTEAVDSFRREYCRPSRGLSRIVATALDERITAKVD